MQAYARIGAVKCAEYGKKVAVQGRVADTDGDDPAFQAPVVDQLQLGGLELFVGNLYMGIEFLALRGQGDTMVGTDEQSAAKLIFQIAHESGYIGLIAG